MRRILLILSLLAIMSIPGFAAPRGQQGVPTLPATLRNARYVYVTSYDGNQFDPNLLPEDRAAIGTVQNAIEQQGKFIVVYEPRNADIVMMVQSRPSEDVLAVYDAHGWPDNEYLWRVMGAGGLQKDEIPLVTQFEHAFDKANLK